MTTRRRILVVDDEESVRFTFDAFLTDAGYQVDTATSFDEGMARAGEADYDAIFLDILLGRQNGLHILRFVRDRNPNCPVVMVTGAPDIGSAAEAVRLGAFDYVSKPVRQEELLHIARQAIERKKLLDLQETYRLRLAAVFQSIQEGILVFDDEFRLVDINEAACRMLACDKEMVGKTLDEMARTDHCSIAAPFREAVMQRCSGEIYRMRLLNNAGQPLLVSLTIAPLTSQTRRENGVVLVLRDESQAVNPIDANAD
jgi:PAS domain S-box-containing protein